MQYYFVDVITALIIDIRCAESEHLRFFLVLQENTIVVEDSNLNRLTVIDENVFGLSMLIDRNVNFYVCFYALHTQLRELHRHPIFG